MATEFRALKACGISPVCVIKSVVIYSLLLSTCGAASNADGPTTSSNSITRSPKGSTPIDDSEILWEVKLRSLAALRCSGVLLDSSWVLTAASCFQGNYLQPTNYNIELYSKNDVVQNISKTSAPTSAYLQDPTASSASFTSSSSSSSSSLSLSSSSSSTTPHHSDQSIYVESFYLHGRFVEGESRNNLALVRLHDNVTSRSVFADVIGPGDDVNGDDCVTVGWGSNVTGEPVQPNVRRWSVLNHTLCSQRYHHHNNFTVHPDQLCAHPLDPTSTGGVCKGDIGAPLLCRRNVTWTVRGLVTHTWRCHDHDQDPQPARFLNVQHYLPFVQKRGNFKGLRVIV